MGMTQTVLYGALETEVGEAEGDRLWIPLDELARSTGWTAKPEGLCRDEVCVPVPAARRGAWLDGPRLDFAAFAAHLGHAVARDEARGVWAFGPSAEARASVAGDGPVMAPDIPLPDLDGDLHALSEYRGKKVLLYSWASW
jgi:hypothetical protein